MCTTEQYAAPSIAVDTPTPTPLQGGVNVRLLSKTPSSLLPTNATNVFFPLCRLHILKYYIIFETLSEVINPLYSLYKFRMYIILQYWFRIMFRDIEGRKQCRKQCEKSCESRRTGTNQLTHLGGQGAPAPQPSEATVPRTDNEVRSDCEVIFSVKSI